MKLEHINTELGNQILKDLLQAGWKKSQEYNVLAFDKGIDFDSYTLIRGEAQLEFEWTNWFEWEVTGPKHVIQALMERYEL